MTSPRSRVPLIGAATTNLDIFTIMTVCPLHCCTDLADELLSVRLVVAGST